MLLDTEMVSHSACAVGLHRTNANDSFRQPRAISEPRPHSNRRLLRRVCAVFVCTLWLAQANLHAEESESQLSLNGFGTLGATKSSSRHAGFVRDLSQPHGSQGSWNGNIDSLLGLQANWNASKQLTFVTQVISRYHNGGTYSPELMWAFARYDLNGNLSLRAGRLATDFYLLSESRQVGYTYLPVRPVTDFFGLLPFSHIDGGDAQFTTPIGDALLRGRLHLGWLNESLPLADREWSLKGSRMAGASIGLQQGPWTIRLSSSEVHFKHNLPIDDLINGMNNAAAYFPTAAGAASRLDVAQSHSRFDSIGTIYENGPFQAQFMWSTVHHSSAAFQNWKAGYALAGYRIEQFTPFASYSWIRSKARSLSSGIPAGVGLDALNAGFSSVLADSHSQQHTTSLGVRWDMQTNIDLKFQVDFIRGKAESIFPFRDEKSAWDGRSNVFTLVLDYIF